MMKKNEPDYIALASVISGPVSDGISSIPGIDIERFMDGIPAALSKINSSLWKIRENTESAVNAFLSCARSGFYPDESNAGFFKVTSQNIGTKQKPEWLNLMEYELMIEGVRRICSRHGVEIYSELRYEKDKFKRTMGDKPTIVHEMPDGERGEPVGVYAIFKEGAKVLHREYMDKDQVMAAAEQAKTPDVWRKFPSEMWRKTCIYRGAKSVPQISERPEAKTAIASVEDHYDFGGGHHVTNPAIKANKETKPDDAAPDDNQEIEEGEADDEIEAEAAPEPAPKPKASPSKPPARKPAAPPPPKQAARPRPGPPPPPPSPPNNTPRSNGGGESVAEADEEFEELESRLTSCNTKQEVQDVLDEFAQYIADSPNKADINKLAEVAMQMAE